MVLLSGASDMLPPTEWFCRGQLEPGKTPMSKWRPFTPVVWYHGPSSMIKISALLFQPLQSCVPLVCSQHQRSLACTSPNSFPDSHFDHAACSRGIEHKQRSL